MSHSQAAGKLGMRPLHDTHSLLSLIPRPLLEIKSGSGLGTRLLPFLIRVQRERCSSQHVHNMLAAWSVSLIPRLPDKSLGMRQQHMMYNYGWVWQTVRVHHSWYRQQLIHHTRQLQQVTG